MLMLLTLVLCSPAPDDWFGFANYQGIKDTDIESFWVDSSGSSGSGAEWVRSLRKGLSVERGLYPADRASSRGVLLLLDKDRSQLTFATSRKVAEIEQVKSQLAVGRSSTSRVFKVKQTGKSEWVQSTHLLIPQPVTRNGVTTLERSPSLDPMFQRFFRLYDDMLVESRTPLPDALPNAFRDNKQPVREQTVCGEFGFTGLALPVSVRRKFQTLLNLKSGTQLQRRDNEGDDEHLIRLLQVVLSETFLSSMFSEQSSIGGQWAYVESTNTTRGEIRFKSYELMSLLKSGAGKNHLMLLTEEAPLGYVWARLDFGGEFGRAIRERLRRASNEEKGGLTRLLSDLQDLEFCAALQKDGFVIGLHSKNFDLLHSIGQVLSKKFSLGLEQHGTLIFLKSDSALTVPKPDNDDASLEITTTESIAISLGPDFLQAGYFTGDFQRVLTAALLVTEETRQSSHFTLNARRTGDTATCEFDLSALMVRIASILFLTSQD